MNEHVDYMHWGREENKEGSAPAQRTHVEEEVQGTSSSGPSDSGHAGDSPYH